MGAARVVAVRSAPGHGGGVARAPVPGGRHGAGSSAVPRALGHARAARAAETALRRPHLFGERHQGAAGGAGHPVRVVPAGQELAAPLRRRHRRRTHPPLAPDHHQPRRHGPATGCYEIYAKYNICAYPTSNPDLFCIFRF